MFFCTVLVLAIVLDHRKLHRLNLAETKQLKMSRLADVTWWRLCLAGKIVFKILRQKSNHLSHHEKWNKASNWQIVAHIADPIFPVENVMNGYRFWEREKSDTDRYLQRWVKSCASNNIVEYIRNNKEWIKWDKCINQIHWYKYHRNVSKISIQKDSIARGLNQENPVTRRPWTPPERWRRRRRCCGHGRWYGEGGAGLQASSW